MSSDLEVRLRHTMHAVARATPVPARPLAADGTTPTRHRLGRRATAVIAAGGIVVLGVGAAAATGELTPGARQTFNGWQNINPRDAILVATLPGPYGTEIAAYEAPDHTNGETCIAFLLRHDPAYQSSAGIGGACANWSHDDNQFGRSGSSLSKIEFPGEPSFSIFLVSAGAAVSGDLVYGGTSHPVAVGNGYIVAWAPASDGRTATLTARDSDGTKVGEIREIGADQPELIDLSGSQRAIAP